MISTIPIAALPPITTAAAAAATPPQATEPPRKLFRLRNIGPPIRKIIGMEEIGILERNLEIYYYLAINDIF